jgi:nucleoside-diphosphate-sugar epimerase
MEERMSDGDGRRVLVTGAGGFIGHHLVTYLKQRGYWVRGVDLKYPEYTDVDADEFELRDLRRWDECLLATRGVDEVYALAADMGGMGFISANHATILRNNALITYDGGREKAPAALCRKVAAAEPGESIEVWGDGEQTRSFCYVDDCVEGIYRVMQSDYPEPLNLGTEEMVAINELARLVIDVASKDGITLRHVDGPQGVRGRNSDNRQLRKVLGWEPPTRLADGLPPTYRWIEKQVRG